MKLVELEELKASSAGGEPGALERGRGRVRKDGKEGGSVSGRGSGRVIGRGEEGRERRRKGKRDRGRREGRDCVRPRRRNKSDTHNKL